jgi:hypothetical protein
VSLGQQRMRVTVVEPTASHPALLTETKRFVVGYQTGGQSDDVIRTLVDHVGITKRTEMLVSRRKRESCHIVGSQECDCPFVHPVVPM